MAALQRYQGCQHSTFTFSVGLSSRCSDKMIGAVVRQSLFRIFSPKASIFFLIACKRFLEKFTWVYTFYSCGREGGRGEKKQYIVILLCNHFSVTSSSHQQCCTAFCLFIPGADCLVSVQSRVAVIESPNSSPKPALPG